MIIFKLFNLAMVVAPASNQDLFDNNAELAKVFKGAKFLKQQPIGARLFSPMGEINSCISFQHWIAVTKSCEY